MSVKASDDLGPLRRRMVAEAAASGLRRDYGPGVDEGSVRIMGVFGTQRSCDKVYGGLELNIFFLCL